MPNKQCEAKQFNTAVTLLDIVSEQANIGGKHAELLIAAISELLLEDGFWTLKYISQKRALALVNLLEDFAHTGKRPKSDEKIEKGVRI